MKRFHSLCIVCIFLVIMLMIPSFSQSSKKIIKTKPIKNSKTTKPSKSQKVSKSSIDTTILLMYSKKKPYFDTTTKKLFWPLEMPFWIRLATSPKKGDLSYLIEELITSKPVIDEKNKEEVKTEEQEFSYTHGQIEKGIKLESPGNQYIRWYNSITNERFLLKFTCDGNPPKTSAKLSLPPSFTTGNKRYYGSGVSCDITATDKYSGVNKIFVSLGNSAFKEYSKPLTFEKEDNYVLRFFSVDNVGYAGKPDSISFTVDLTAPVSQHTVHGNYDNNILSSKATIKLIGSDSLSGLKSIHYRFDENKKTIKYKGTDIILTEFKEGEHVLYYHSVDNIGNQEKEKSYKFYLDKTPPSVISKVEGGRYTIPKGKDYISPTSQVALSATDSKVKIESIEYAINSNKFVIFTKPFTLPIEASASTVKFRARDKMGNISPVSKITLAMDSKNPTSKYELDGPNHSQRGIIWITKETKIKLSSTDDASGVQEIQYQQNKGKTVVYRTPISIVKEGRHLMRFRGIDMVGNKENAQAMVIIVDNTPPEILETFSVANTGKKLTKDSISLTVYPRRTSVFLESKDKSSGTQSIWYSINGAKEKEYNKPLSFSKEGTYALLLRSTDNLGNESKKTVSFVIQE